MMAPAIASLIQLPRRKAYTGLTGGLELVVLGSLVPTQTCANIERSRVKINPAGGSSFFLGPQDDFGALVARLCHPRERGLGGTLVRKRSNPDAEIDFPADLDRCHVDRRDRAKQSACLFGILLGLKGSRLDHEALRWRFRFRRRQGRAVGGSGGGPARVRLPAKLTWFGCLLARNSASRRGCIFPRQSEVFRVLSRQRVFAGSAAHRYRPWSTLLERGIGGEPSPVLVCGKSLLVAVVAVQWRPAEIFDADIGRPVRPEDEQVGRVGRQIEDPVARIRTAVVDTDNNSPSIREIGYLRIDRQRQGGMRGGEAVHVVDFTVGGATAVEQLAVPGRPTDPVVPRILARRVPGASHLIGVADA